MNEPTGTDTSRSSDKNTDRSSDRGSNDNASSNDNRSFLQWFKNDHLPSNLQKVSQPYVNLAQHIIDSTPSGSQQTAALQHLLESKDAAVRAAMGRNTGSVS